MAGPWKIGSPRMTDAPIIAAIIAAIELCLAKRSGVGNHALQAGPGDEMTFVFAACTTRVRLFGATVVLLLATPAVSAQDTSSQGGSITSDKPIYRFGEQVSITYATPNDPLQDSYDVFLVTPSPEPALCASGVPRASEGGCTLDTTTFYNPDRVSSYLRVDMTVMPDPGLNSVASGQFWVERLIEERPGALAFPDGTVLRPWQALIFRVDDVPGLLTDYGALRVELARVARLYPGGGIEASARLIQDENYANDYFRPALSNVRDLSARRASQPGGALPDTFTFVPGPSRFLPLGQYEFRLIGADDRIIDRAALSVELAPLGDVFELSDPPDGTDAYPVADRPDITLVLPPEVARSPLPIGLAVQVLRIGDGGTRQMVGYRQPIAACRGWPDCAADLFEPDESYRHEVVLLDMMPGRYEARLVLIDDAYDETDTDDQLILAQQEFVLEGEVEPWRSPPADRQILVEGDIELMLDREDYAVSDMARLRLQPREGVELQGETLWISLRRNQVFAYGCTPMAPQQVAYSAFSPLIGNATPDSYAMVTGQPYHPLNDPSVPRSVLESADYAAVLQEIADDARAGVAREVYAGPPEDAAYETIPWIGWSEDGETAEIALNMPPGRYQLALMRGTASASQAGRDTHFADAQTVATVEFLVTAPPLDVQSVIEQDGQDVRARLMWEGDVPGRLELDAVIVFDADPGTGAIRPRRTGANTFRDNPTTAGFDVEVPLGEPFQNTGNTDVFLAEAGTQYGWRHVELIDRYGLVRWEGALVDTHDPSIYFGRPSALYPPEPDISRRSTQTDHMAPHIWMPSAADCGPNPPGRTPELQAVVWIGGDPETPDDDVYEPVDRVFPGYPFLIEARFEDPPGQETYEIEVDNGPRILVERTEDPGLYRSEILTIQPEDGP
jgi:hypothetical protein